jgi:hypothetical protein
LPGPRLELTKAALLLTAAAHLACSEAAAPCAPFDYSRYQAKSHPSFRRDIQPILAVSCALSTACHGTDRGRAPQQPPLLGPNVDVTPDDAMLVAIVADLLQPAARAPGLARVKPGRPQESFLVHKLDGSQSCAGVACFGGCGTRMPQTGDPLPSERIDQLRDWILDGAQNN